MTNLTGKFLVVGGVRFAQVADDENNANPCLGCAFQTPRGVACRVDLSAELEQGLDCVTDKAHYEVAQ